MSPALQEKPPMKHSHDAVEGAHSWDMSPAQHAKPHKKHLKHSEKRGILFGGGGLRRKQEKDTGDEVKGAGSGRAAVLDNDQGTASGDESSDTSSDIDMEIEAEEAGGGKGALKSNKKKSRVRPKGSTSGHFVQAPDARKVGNRRGALKGDIYHEFGARDRRGALKGDIYHEFGARDRRGAFKGDHDQAADEDDNESSSEESTSSSSGSGDHQLIKKHAQKKQAKKKEDILLTKSESVQTSFILCRDAETGASEHQAAEVTVKYNKIETCTVEGPVPFKKRTRLVGSDDKAKLWNSDLPYPKESKGKKRLVGARLVYESNMVPFFVDINPYQGSSHQKSNESEKCPQKTSGRLSQMNYSTALSPLRRHMGTSCQKSNESEMCPQKTSGSLSQMNSSTALSPLRRHVGMVKTEASQKENTIGDKENYLSQNHKQLEHVYLDDKLKTLQNKQEEVNVCNQVASKLSSLTAVETGGANSCSECFHRENGLHAECVSVTEKLRFFSPLTSPLSSQLYLTLCSEDSGLVKGVSQPSSFKEKGHRKDSYIMSNVQNVMADHVFREAEQFSTEKQDKEKSAKFQSPRTSQHGREDFLKAAHPYQTKGEEEEDQQSKTAQTPELFRTSTDRFSLIYQAQSDPGQGLSLSDPEKFPFILQDTIKPQTETISKPQSQLYTTQRLLKETDSDVFFSSIQDSHELTDYRDPLEYNKAETFSEEKDHNLHNETDIRNLSYQQKKESVLKLLKTAPNFYRPPSGVLASTQSDSGTISLVSLSGDVKSSSTIDDILNSNASTVKFTEPQETSSWTTGMNQTELMKTEASEENELLTDPSVDANANKNIDLNPVVEKLEKKQFKLLKTLCVGESRLKIYGKGQFCCCKPCSAPIYQSICSAYSDPSESFCPNTSQECTCGDIVRTDNCLSHACSDQFKCLHSCNLRQDPSTVADAYAGHQQERSFSPLGRQCFSRDKLQKCVRFSKSTIMESSNSDSCQDIFASSSSSTSTRDVSAKADENQLKKMLNFQIQKFLETTKWASTKDASDIQIDWARTQKNKKRGSKTSSQYSARLCSNLSEPGKRRLSSQHSITMKPGPYSRPCTTFPSQPCLYYHLYPTEKTGKMLSNSLEKQAESHPSYALNDKKSHLSHQFESKTSAWTDSLLNSDVNYKSFTPTDQQLPGNSMGVYGTGVCQYQHFHSDTSMFDHNKQSWFPQVSTDCMDSQKSTSDTLKSNWSCEMLQHSYLSSPRARNDDQLKMSPKTNGGLFKSPSARSSLPSSARYLDSLRRCDALSLGHKTNYEIRPNVSLAGQSTVRFLVDASDDEEDSFATATEDIMLLPLSGPTMESFRNISSEHSSFIASASEEDERDESFFTMPENDSFMFSPIQCSPGCIPGRKKEIGKPWSSHTKFSREEKSLSPRTHMSCARNRPAYNGQASSFKRREFIKQDEKRLGESKNRLGLPKTLFHNTDSLHRGLCQETLKNRSFSDGYSNKRLKQLLSSRLSKISFSDTSLDTSQTNSHVNSITGKCSSYTSLYQKRKFDKLQERPPSFSNLEFNVDEKYPKYDRPALNRKSTVEYYVDEPHLHTASTNQRKHKRSPLMAISKMSSHELADEFKSHESQRRYSEDSRMKNKQSPRRSSLEYKSCPRNAKVAECKTDQSFRSMEEPKYQIRSSEKIKSPRRPSDKCETHRNKHNTHTQLSDEHHQKRYSNVSNPSKDAYNRRSTEMCQSSRKTEDRECTTDLVQVNSYNELDPSPKRAYLQNKKELHSLRKYSFELNPRETNLKSKKDSKIQKRLSREISPSKPWLTHDSPQRKSSENYKAVGSEPSPAVSQYSSLPRRLSINFKNEKSILNKYTSDQCEKGKTSLKTLEESKEETFIDKFISDQLQQAKTSLGKYKDNYTSLDKSTSDESEQGKATLVTSDKCNDDQINLDKSALEESKKANVRLEENNDKQTSLKRRPTDEHKSKESYLQKRHSDESLQTLCKSLCDSPTRKYKSLQNRSSDDSEINLHSHRKKVGQWEPDPLTHNKQTPLNQRHSDLQKSKESYLQKRHSDESLQTLCKSICDSPTRRKKSLQNRSSDDSDINLFLHRKKVGPRQPDQSTIYRIPSWELESSLHKMPTDKISQKISDDCRDNKSLGRRHSDHFPNFKITEQKFSAFALKSNKTNSHRISKDACKPSTAFHSISVDNLNQDKISKQVTKPAKSFKSRQLKGFHSQQTSVHGTSSNFLRSNPAAATHQVNQLSSKNKLLFEDSEQSDTTYSEVRTFSEQMTKEDSRSFKSVTSFDSLLHQIGRDQSQNKREDLTGEGSMVSSSVQHSENLQPVVHTNSMASSAPHFVLSQKTRQYFDMPESLTDKRGAEDEQLKYEEEESTSTQFYDSVHLTRFRYSAESPEALRRNPNYKPSVLFEETDLAGYLLAGHCVSDIDLLISEHEISGSMVDTGYHLSQSSNSNAIQTLDENICAESLSIGSQSMQAVNIVIHTVNGGNKPDVSSKGPKEEQTSPASIIYHSVISDQTNFETLADTSTSKASNRANFQNPLNDYLLDDNEEFFSLSCSTFMPCPCPNTLPGINNQLNDTSKLTKEMHHNSDTKSSSEADTLFFSPNVTAKISPTPEKHSNAGDQRKESMREQKCQLQPDQLVKDSAEHPTHDRNIKYALSSHDTQLDLQSVGHNNQPVSSFQERMSLMSPLDQKECIQRKDMPVQIQPLDLSTKSSLQQSTACVNSYTQSVHQLPQAKVSIKPRVEHWKPLQMKKKVKSKHKKVCPSSGFYRHTIEPSTEVFIDNCQDKSCQATISEQVQNQGIIPQEDLSQSIQLLQDPSQHIHQQQDPSQNIHQQQDPSQNIHILKEQISGIIPLFDLSQDSFSESKENVEIENKIAENLLLELGANKLSVDIQTENVRVLMDDIEYDNTSKPSHSKKPFYWNKKELFSEDLLGDESDWIQSAAENTLSDVSSDIFEKSGPNDMLRLAARRTNAFEMAHLLQSNSIEEVILNEAEEEQCSTSSDTSDCTQPPCVLDQDDISDPKMSLQQEAPLKLLGEPSKACLCPPKQFEKYEVQYKSTLLYEHSPSKDEACCINYIQPKSVNILAHPLCDLNVGIKVELSPQHPKPKGSAQKGGCGKDPLGQQELNYFEPDKLTNLIHSKKKWGLRLANVSPQSNQHSPISFQGASLIREICVSDRETQATSLIREICVSDRETQATSLMREICVSDRETQADLSCSSQPITPATDHSIYRSSVLNEAEPEEFTASLVYLSQSSDQSFRHSAQCTDSADYLTQGFVTNSQQGRFVSPVSDVYNPSFKKIQDSFVTSSQFKVTATLEKKTERLMHAPPSEAEVSINVIRQGQRLTQNSMHAVEFEGYQINTSPSSDRQNRPQRKGNVSREKSKNVHVLANTQCDHQPATFTAFSSPEALEHQMHQQFPDVARHRRSRSQSRKQKFNYN